MTIALTYEYTCDHCGAEIRTPQKHRLAYGDVVPAPVSINSTLHGDDLCDDCAHLARIGLDKAST